MFAHLADHAPIGLFLTGDDGRMTYVNGCWCRMTGMTADACLGFGWLAALHPEDREKVRAAWREAVARRKDFHGQYRLLGPDGQVTWVEANASPLEEEGGYVGSCAEITGRKNAESRLRLYETIFSTSPDFVYVFGIDHRIIYANKSLLNTWGRTLEETVGKTWLELGYEAWHAEMHDRELDLVIRTKRQWRSEIPFTGAHGRRIYDYIFVPVLNEKNEVEAIAGTTRDVTERKQAEERAHFLSELAARLAPLSTEADIIRTTVEMVGRHLNCHRCYFVETVQSEDLIRSSPDWVRDGAPSLVGDYRLSDFGDKEWWSQQTGGDILVEDVETSPVTRDRAEVYKKLGVRSFATQPFERAGPSLLMLAVTENQPRVWRPEEIELLSNVVPRVWPLVEQARALEAIRQSQQRLALVAEAGRVILESETLGVMLQKIWGAACQHLGTDICLTLMFAGNPETPRVEFSHGLDEEVVARIVEFHSRESFSAPGHRAASAADRRTHVLLTDEERVSGYSSYPLIVGEELLGHLIFASRTRGDFSEAEQEFLGTLARYVTGAYVRLRLLEDLRESDRRKDQFLATLAHELRNPLAPILTGLEIMKRSGSRPATLEQVTGIIERQIGQMAYLINDLLDMSRVNTGKIVLKKGRVPLATVLESAIEASQPLFEERRHQLTVEMPDHSVVVEVDPSRVAQVVSNLLSNAAKYTPSGGEVRLTASVHDGGFIVRVRDNGLGIDLADQQTIFDLFQQTSHGSSDGLGIGLTLVKSLVELHGGSVTVYSEGVSKGSEFIATFNDCVRISHNPTTPVSSSVSHPASSSTRKRILVVDDGKSAADMLALFFRLEGMEVEVAYDGREGVDKAISFQPHLVIMDLGMPVMDGLEAARLMRQNQVTAILIALSGWGREQDKKRTTEAGFDDHMIKPISPDDLREAMKRHFPD